MTKLEKRFLNCCIKNYINNSVIGSDDLLLHLDSSLFILQKCAEKLEQKGYIKNLHIQTRIRFNFQLTYEGIMYKEIRFKNHKDFILKSIFVPVVVSVITSLIIAVVGYLWSMESIKLKSQNPIPTPTTELITETSGPNHGW
ncbi:hypothetical protein NE683_12150 [Bariatricus massiliensis]|uniref:Uncharacterized protein n=1 Tax=Bariatricus massiliensis TaxID=1745713 RepID=A0ABS8DH39_9FIRM|nr:hypothetical protein [Bariatricus massiliensis]MCB7304574.1 hypothetical protein [Bariatricus massiliensis]MCB7375226.1 hypothetical protein [Bariatricus massiliensis]MCB7387685.1 hypothetical protein [Bariatricus massiliensis]MCB7411846.1 hypothetical protein [Bariatricus massiliensis]MCQ5253982.1 hypothetical protein [Bariatricus massiliensis]